jgi:hypothetical protein
MLTGSIARALSRRIENPALGRYSLCSARVDSGRVAGQEMRHRVYLLTHLPTLRTTVFNSRSEALREIIRGLSALDAGG